MTEFETDTPGGVKSKRRDVFQLPLSVAEKAALRVLSDPKGMTLSDYIRDRLGLPPMKRGAAAHKRNQKGGK